ncbi:MAG: hypothetical protein JSV79_14230, partial [Armatimonadota bacterium]
AIGAGRALLGFQKPSQEVPHPRFPLSTLHLWPALATAAALPYLHGLTIGFLSDDFGLVRAAIEAESAADVIRLHPYVLFYRPLSELLWWAGAKLWGAAPLGYHVLHLALHAANSVLVSALAARLLGSRIAAATAGLLFALHPIHVEPVIWAACQPDLLATAFALLSLLLLEAHLAATARPAQGLWLLAALTAFGLSMFSKESSLALPGVVVLRLALMSPVPSRRRTVGIGAAYAVVLIAFLGWRFSALGKIGGYKVSFIFWNTVFPSAPLRQLGAFFFPIHRPLLLDTGGLALLAAALLLMLAGLIWCIRGLAHVPARRLWFYLGYLAIISSPVWFIGNTIAADMENSRLAYLPTVALAWLFGDICAGRHAGKQFNFFPPAAMLLAAAALTGWYVVPWKQADALAQDVLAAGRKLVSELPPAEQPPLLFVRGLPDIHRGAQVFRSGFEPALRTAAERPLLIRTVARHAGSASVAAEAFQFSSLLPNEYEVAWRGDTKTMEIVRSGTIRAPNARLSGSSP